MAGCRGGRGVSLGSVILCLVRREAKASSKVV